VIATTTSHSPSRASYGPEQVELAVAHVRRLHRQGTAVLIQPLLTSVMSEGEWPLIYLGGAYSHAASKRVVLPHAGMVDDLFAAEENRDHDPDDDQLAVANAAVQVVTGRFGAPLYARVDLVRDNAGEICVLELELVEPSLFLPQARPEALDRVVATFTADGR
jgi:hypothetical protein